MCVCPSVLWAQVVELVDTQVSEACVARHRGSSPRLGTTLKINRLGASSLGTGLALLLALLAEISLILGDLIACSLAVFGRSGNRPAFIKKKEKKGFSLALCVLAAFPTAFLPTLVVSFVTVGFFRFSSHDELLKDQRFAVMKDI